MGSAVGVVDGNDVGNDVGVVGNDVGTDVGAVGNDVGTDVGVVGNDVGTDVGAVGDADGLGDGCGDGAATTNTDEVPAHAVVEKHPVSTKKQTFIRAHSKQS